MHTIKIDTAILERAAKADGTSPEEYLSNMRSLSLGRKVCAHFKRTEGPLSVFVCA